MFASVLGLPEHTLSDLFAILLFGGVATVVLIGGTMTFDWAWKKIDFQAQINNSNVAAAVVIAAVVIGLSIVMSQVTKSVIGGS